MKNPNDTIGNRTRNLLGCSAVPQPNAPPGCPVFYYYRREKGPIGTSFVNLICSGDLHCSGLLCSL